MVPIIIPRKKGEARPAEAEPEKAAQRRERKREEDANLPAPRHRGERGGHDSLDSGGDRGGGRALRSSRRSRDFHAGRLHPRGLSALLAQGRAAMGARGRPPPRKVRGPDGVPGSSSSIPIVETVSNLIDQRMRVTDVTAESALTRDTVPVNVDAIVFWTVWDAAEVGPGGGRLQDAISMSAQTALREAIGRHLLAEMITEREQLERSSRPSSTRKRTPGASPCTPSRSGTCTFPRSSRTP